ncbi:WhiB family transcriptional regulator [Propionibacterium freudenreichii]|uniref:WhiB family transcriptional regulator n=1 Tax=Propionibacterium freudenreichii TaxID=1744 RepID=UPI0038555C4E
MSWPEEHHDVWAGVEEAIPEWVSDKVACSVRSDADWNADEDSRKAVAAVRICERCAFTEKCLDWALAHHEAGIWGGLTASDRERIERGESVRRVRQIRRRRTAWRQVQES